MLAVLSAAFASNETPETPTDEKIPEPDVPGVTVPAAEDGSLDFEIFNDNGGGDGLLPEEPAVATVSEPLEMSIIQSSSYNDPDGTVYECEPKAEIVLRASVDTVFVKDIRSFGIPHSLCCPSFPTRSGIPFRKPICDRSGVPAG